MRRRAYKPFVKPDTKPCPFSRVEGPVPEDVWGGSTTEGFFDLNLDGCATTIAREHIRTGGLYLQVAGNGGGWLFFPALDNRPL
jgi:hypothetical protein